MSEEQHKLMDSIALNEARIFLIIQVQNTIPKHLICLLQGDWSLICTCIRLLEPIYYASLQLQEEDASISKAVVIIQVTSSSENIKPYFDNTVSNRLTFYRRSLLFTQTSSVIRRIQMSWRSVLLYLRSVTTTCITRLQRNNATIMKLENLHFHHSSNIFLCIFSI